MTNTTAYFELDLAGNVRGLRASGGASLGDYRYSAFGQTLEDTTMITQPLGYATVGINIRGTGCSGGARCKGGRPAPRLA